MKFPTKETLQIRYISSKMTWFIFSPFRIPADLRSTVYYYGVASGSDDEWDFVFKKYSESSNPSEKGKLQSALSASEKPWILRKYVKHNE